MIVLEIIADTAFTRTSSQQRVLANGHRSRRGIYTGISAFNLKSISYLCLYRGTTLQYNRCVCHALQGRKPPPLEGLNLWVQIGKC